MQKTPPKLQKKANLNEEKILEKLSPPGGEKPCDAADNSIFLKETIQIEPEFKTPKKISHQNVDNQLVENQISEIKTPIKNLEKFDLKLELMPSCDVEDGMISTTEQARLLIAANKTPSKSTNKTPVKKNTPSGKRSIENSPVTPGKYKRVELTTLASPKTKKIKQI